MQQPVSAASRLSSLWIVSLQHSWKFLPAEEKAAWAKTARLAYFSPLGPKSQPQTCLNDFMDTIQDLMSA